MTSTGSLSRQWDYDCAQVGVSKPSSALTPICSKDLHPYSNPILTALLSPQPTAGGSVSEQVAVFQRKWNPSGVVSEGQWPLICATYHVHCPLTELVYIYKSLLSYLHSSVIPAFLAVAEVSFRLHNSL